MAREKLDISRLCMAMQRARLILRRPREMRVQLTRQYVGENYSEEGASKPVPLNLLATYVRIIGQKLISNHPRVMLSTWDRSARPVVTAMQDWANKEIVRLHLANTLKRVVIDGLFSLGICKVGICDPGMAATLGWGLRAGEPFCQRVDLDDFVFDIHARDFSECSFIGHRYRVPLRVVQESKLYSKDRENLTPADDSLYNQQGDERISVIGRTTMSGGDTLEFEDMVDLWEVYLPRHRLIVTLKDGQMGGEAEGSSDEALRIQRWFGPNSGPYHLLGFGVVPGNCMPKAPLQDLLVLHESINRMLRKLIRQADNQKSVGTYTAGAAEDANRISNTNDMEWAGVTDPRNVDVKSWNGPNQNVFQLFTAFKELYSWLAGNLESIGGLGPQSHTATQDELLASNSSATVTEMQDQVMGLTSGVLNSLCWYWHHDPRRIMKVTHSVPGMSDISAQMHIHPAGQGVSPQGQPRLSRNHTYEDMDIQVDPYSLNFQTPQQRLMALNQLMSQVLAPLMPMLQQQNLAVDFQEYLRKWARYNNDPDVEDIVTIAPAQTRDQPSPEGPSAPPTTTRNYNRRSVGGATGKGKDVMAVNGMKQEANGQTLGGGLA